MALPKPKQIIEQSIPIRVPAYQTPLISPDDWKQLDKLTGAAAFDKNIEHRLVVQRDDTLTAIYHISAKTWGYLKQIEADTLYEFCKQVLELQNTMVNH